MRSTIAAAVFLLTCSVLLFSRDYQIVPADNLWNLSAEFYGDGFRWEHIWEHNRYIQNPHLIYPGDVLFLPDIGPVRVADTVVSGRASQTPEPDFSEAVAPLFDDNTEDSNENKPSEPVQKDRELSRFISPRAFSFISSSGFYQTLPYITKDTGYDGALLLDRRILSASNKNLPVRFGADNASQGEYYSVVDLSQSFQDENREEITLAKPVALGYVTSPDRNDTAQFHIERNWDVIPADARLIKLADYESRGFELGEFQDRADLEAGLVARVSEKPFVHPFEFMFIDKGRHQGVDPGDLFALSDADGGPADQEEPEVFAMVVASEDTTATVMITNVHEAFSADRYRFIRYGTMKK
ncbi:MAG: LysM peptidoglycan-binding domain-containing protein [Fibrobacterota bacterium]